MYDSNSRTTLPTIPTLVCIYCGAWIKWYNWEALYCKGWCSKSCQLSISLPSGRSGVLIPGGNANHDGLGTTKVISLKWISGDSHSLPQETLNVKVTLMLAQQFTALPACFNTIVTDYCCTFTYTCMTLNPEKDRALSSLNGVHDGDWNLPKRCLLKIA